jgi:hypothetical protein
VMVRPSSVTFDAVTLTAMAFVAATATVPPMTSLQPVG